MRSSGTTTSATSKMVIARAGTNPGMIAPSCTITNAVPPTGIEHAGM